MTKMHWCAAGLTVLATGGLAAAAVTVDGTLDGAYGAPIVVQQVPTGFGDSNLGQVGPANGSELNAAYGFVSGGNLHLFLSGNLESNFNKIELFFDTVAGGQNKLRGDNAGVDFGGLNRMGDDGSGNGLRFDAGFNADYWIGASGNGTDLFANYAVLATDGGGPGYYAGQGGYGTNGALSGGEPGAPMFFLTINNSNTTGVTGDSAPNDAATVNTGIELVIPLADLGNPTDFVRVVAFVNGGGHDFASNQFLGPLPPGTGNLGEPRNIDLSQFAGDQFFTVVVPEPASLGVVALGSVMVLARRRGLRRM